MRSGEIILIHCKDFLFVISVRSGKMVVNLAVNEFFFLKSVRAMEC